MNNIYINIKIKSMKLRYDYSCTYIWLFLLLVKLIVPLSRLRFTIELLSRLPGSVREFRISFATGCIIATSVYSNILHEIQLVFNPARGVGPNSHESWHVNFTTSFSCTTHTCVSKFTDIHKYSLFVTV